jgi:sialidase-1
MSLLKRLLFTTVLTSVMSLYGEESLTLLPDGVVTTTNNVSIKLTFKFNGLNAWIKVPKSNPNKQHWVMRSRWAEFHTETDHILLSKGFYIAFVDAGGMLGCDEALDIWDKFYDHLVNKYGFGKEMSLEAVSRGGLFALRWAARHPERINSIYLDSPVCDLKSWPLGKWKGDKDKTGIKQIQKYYGLNTAEEILAYDENPVDDKIVSVIAKHKIPIMALVNDVDRIVPPSENIYIFAKKYNAISGMDVKILHPKPNGNFRLKGHHFVVPNPEIPAEFIINNTNKK